MRDKLAILGGKKLINSPFKKYNSIGNEEVEAAKKVVESGSLSNYLGTWSSEFYGGHKVKEFEKKCAEYFNMKYAITTNSWTSGLTVAVGAIGINPGDEIIVSPWTMCASATSILHWNAIPVFADIEEDTFCLDPKSVEKNISPYTKAIMSVDIAGQSANMDELKKIAKKYNLKIISDTAQAPGALYKDKFAGTLADIGGYSLNCHKHIHTGEGGVLVTNDDELAENMYLIRNHAEAVVEGMGKLNLTNMVGHNYRLGEIESAIGIEQLNKLDKIIKRRTEIASILNEKLSKLDGLIIPKVRDNCTHVYYMYQMRVDLSKLNISRNKIYKALIAEGLSGISLSFANIHLLPIFQKKIAYGSNGFPWSSDICKRNVNYNKGICPVAENLQDNIYIGFQMCMHEMDDYEIDLFLKCFYKVWDNLGQLGKI